MTERAKWRFDVRSSLLTLVVVGLCGVAYRAFEHHAPAPPKSKDRIALDLERISRLQVGAEGTLSDPIRGTVAVGRTPEDYEAIVEAQDTGDDISLREIVVSGRGFKTLNGNGAQLLEKDAFGVVKLKLLGGDHTDEIGWSSGEYFH